MSPLPTNSESNDQEKELGKELSPEQIVAIQAQRALESLAENQLRNALLNADEKAIDLELRKLKDPRYLPTRAEICQAFNIDEDADLGSYGYNEIVGLSDKPWAKFAMGKLGGEERVFEFFTQEYIDRLADNIIDSAHKFGASRENPLKVVELGAGNGKLSHFLQKMVEEKEPGLITVIATDESDGEWQHGIDRVSLAVEPLNYIQALKKYHPDIVIVSWMPYEFDMTAAIRNAHVKQYILIGEADNGCCGDFFWTWGYHTLSKETQEVMWRNQQKRLDPMIESTRSIYERTSYVSYSSTIIPPYKVDGYSKTEPESLADFNISRSGESTTRIFTVDPNMSDAERNTRRKHYLELLKKYRQKDLLEKMPKEFTYDESLIKPAQTLSESNVEETDEFKIKLVLDAAEDKEVEITKGELIVTGKDNKKFLLDSDGNKIAEDIRHATVIRKNGRRIKIIYYRGDKRVILNEKNKSIFPDNVQINVESIVISESGEVAAIARENNKKFIITEDGRRIGKEYLDIKELQYFYDDIYFCANTETEEWVVVDENNNQISSEDSGNISKLQKAGGHLIYQSAGYTEKDYKDENGETIGPREGFNNQDKGIIFDNKGHIIVTIGKPSGRGISEQRYYLEDGQEIFPAPGWNQFDDINGELVIRVAADGKESWQTKDKKIVGGEHREVREIKRFSDNTYAINVVDNEDNQPSYVDIDGQNIQFPLDIKVQRLELEKNRDGQYIWIYSPEGDENDYIIDNNGKMMDSGESIYPVPVEDGKTFCLVVKKGNIEYILNDKVEKISEDYEEIKIGNEIQKDASGHYFIIGRRGKQYFKERLKL